MTPTKWETDHLLQCSKMPPFSGHRGHHRGTHPPGGTLPGPSHYCCGQRFLWGGNHLGRNPPTLPRPRGSG